MDFIEEVLNMSYKSNKVGWLSSTLAVSFFFISGVLFSFLGSLGVSIGLIFIGITIVTTMGWVLGEKLGKKIFKSKEKISFEKTKLYKKLEKRGYLCEFKQTINEEIKSENTIKYSCDIIGVGLLVTKTWFVYIDKKLPVVVKTDEIIKISEEISASNSSDFLCVELKDKTYLRMDKLMLSDIENEIKSKYPNIIIGVGVIEE